MSKLASEPSTQSELASEPSTQTEPLLSVENLGLRFGGVTALDGVSFDVAAGELFAVIGPNGAGKTSIFNCVNGVYRPQQGSIRFDGASLDGLRPVRIAERGVARTFQNIGLFPNVSLVDNLMLGRHHLMRTGFLSAMVWWGRARREEIEGRAAVERVVELLELEPYRLMPAGLLPYGVAKRAELARALAMQPRLLLLDEPVAGMNHEETEDMARHIVEVRRELGLAIVLVEHDMRFVMDLADRVMALDFGRMLATGTPEQVQRDPAVVDAYLGRARKPSPEQRIARTGAS